MVLNFEYGFLHKGFEYGWLNKELYRLPSTTNNRYYPFKKMSVCKVGNKTGYRCKKDKISLAKLKDKTVVINKKISVAKSKDLPF